MALEVRVPIDVEEGETEARGERSIIDFSDELRVRAALFEMEARLAAGFNDEAARYEMGLPVSDYDRLKRIYYERETSKLKKATAHEVFIDFALGQQTVLKNIDVLMEEMKDSKQFSAAVGALRLASDIRKRVVEVGQDLGVLDKRPEEKRVLTITGTVDEMRAAVAKEVKAVDAMMKSYGGTKDLLALEPGPIHREAPAPVIEPPSTTGRAAAHHGRRVVRVGRKSSS